MQNQKSFLKEFNMIITLTVSQNVNFPKEYFFNDR